MGDSHYRKAIVTFSALAQLKNTTCDAKPILELAMNKELMVEKSENFERKQKEILD